MIKNLILVIFLVVMVSKFIQGGVFTEFAPVDDDARIYKGYACKSVNAHVGFMREGEERLKYAPDVCGKVKCEDGIITYTTCAELPSAKGCRYIPPMNKKAFPGCCGSMLCKTIT